MSRQKYDFNLKSDEQDGSYYGSGRKGAELYASNEELPEKKDLKFIIKVFDKIIDLSLFMIFLGFPLFFTGLTLQGIVFEKQIFFYFWLVVGVVAWTAKGVTIGEMRIRRTPLDIPVIGLWIACAVATFFSVDRWHSFLGAFADPSRGLMSITAIVIAYYFIFSHYNIQRVKLILAAIVASGTIMSAWTLLAILNIKFLPDNLAQFAPISLSGSMLGMAIILSGLIPIVTVSILKVGENQNLNKLAKRSLSIILLAVLALNLVLVMALYNFIPWLALFAGIVIFLVFILSQIIRLSSNWSWLPMVLFVAIMALRMVGLVPIAKINLAEVKPLDFQTSSNIARESFKNKPLVGSGPATFGYDFSLFKPKEYNNNAFYNLRFLQGTGIVLEAVSTIGGVGTFFLIILLLSFVSVELYLIARGKEKNKLLSLGIFSSAIILLVASATTKVEGTVLIMAALTSIVALATALWESDSHENHLTLSLKASPKYALALAFLFMVVSAGVAFLFVFFGKLYVADVYAGKASRMSSINNEESIKNVTQSISYYGKEARYYTQLSQYYMVVANNEALKGEQERDVQKIKQYINASVAAANLAKSMAVNDVGTQEVVAQIYENTGLYIPDSYNLALENYKKGLDLEPQNPTYYMKIGQIKTALAGSKSDVEEKQQMISEAKDMFSQAAEKKPNLAEAHYELAIALNTLGDRDAAIESGKKAALLNSNNNDYIINLGRMLQNRGNDNDFKDAEQLFKIAIGKNDRDINGHFYLGILYEKQKKKQEAKEEYTNVMSLLPGGNEETRKQLEKMVANVDAGVENTPQNLGLSNEGKVAGEEANEERN